MRWMLRLRCSCERQKEAPGFPTAIISVLHEAMEKPQSCLATAASQDNPLPDHPPPPQLTFPTVASPRPLHSSAENRLSTPLSQILAPSLGWHSDPTSNNGNGISSRKSKSPRPVDNFLHYKKVHIRLQRRQRYVCRICAIVLHFVMQEG